MNKDEEELLEAFGRLPKKQQLVTLAAGTRLIEIMNVLPSKKGFLLLHLKKDEVCVQAFSGDDTSMEFLMGQQQKNNWRQLGYIG